jgi:uncharacterized protein (DUF433 family)
MIKIAILAIATALSAPLTQFDPSTSSDLNVQERNSNMHYEHIVEEEDYNSGQPSLKSGYTVLQVVKLLEADFTIKQAADRLSVPEEEIVEAEKFYQEYTDKIERWRRDEQETIEEYTSGSQSATS